MKTVKEISNLSGVSVRTLHYYDKIDLLKPSFVAENGYRYYDDETFERLQEILLFRELDFPLKEIKKIIDHAGYDKQKALSDQIQFLELKRNRLDNIISHAKSLKEKGDHVMNFTAYDKSELDDYQKEAKSRWGKTAAYKEFEEQNSKNDFSMISLEMTKIMEGFGKLKDIPAEDRRVQTQVKVLQDYISDNFYTCTQDILAGLGEMYVQDDRFKKNIDKAGGTGTASFIRSAISYYCQYKEDLRKTNCIQRLDFVSKP